MIRIPKTLANHAREYSTEEINQYIEKTFFLQSIKDLCESSQIFIAIEKHMTLFATLSANERILTLRKIRANKRDKSISHLFFYFFNELIANTNISSEQGLIKESLCHYKNDILNIIKEKQFRKHNSFAENNDPEFVQKSFSKLIDLISMSYNSAESSLIASPYCEHNAASILNENTFIKITASSSMLGNVFGEEIMKTIKEASVCFKMEEHDLFEIYSLKAFGSRDYLRLILKLIEIIPFSEISEKSEHVINILRMISNLYVFYIKAYEALIQLCEQIMLIFEYLVRLIDSYDFEDLENFDEDVLLNKKYYAKETRDEALTIINNTFNLYNSLSGEYSMTLSHIDSLRDYLNSKILMKKIFSKELSILDDLMIQDEDIEKIFRLVFPLNILKESDIESIFSKEYEFGKYAKEENFSLKIILSNFVCYKKPILTSKNTSTNKSIVSDFFENNAREEGPWFLYNLEKSLSEDIDKLKQEEEISKDLFAKTNLSYSSYLDIIGVEKYINDANKILDSLSSLNSLFNRNTKENSSFCNKHIRKKNAISIFEYFRKFNAAYGLAEIISSPIYSKEDIANRINNEGLIQIEEYTSKHLFLSLYLHGGVHADYFKKMNEKSIAIHSFHILNGETKLTKDEILETNKKNPKAWELLLNNSSRFYLSLPFLYIDINTNVYIKSLNNNYNNEFKLVKTIAKNEIDWDEAKSTREKYDRLNKLHDNSISNINNAFDIFRISIVKQVYQTELLTSLSNIEDETNKIIYECMLSLSKGTYDYLEKLLARIIERRGDINEKLGNARSILLMDEGIDNISNIKAISYHTLDVLNEYMLKDSFIEIIESEYLVRNFSI